MAPATASPAAVPTPHRLTPARCGNTLDVVARRLPAVPHGQVRDRPEPATTGTAALLRCDEDGAQRPGPTTDDPDGSSR